MFLFMKELFIKMNFFKFTRVYYIVNLHQDDCSEMLDETIFNTFHKISRS